ncbi:glycosyltransferase family 15 protein, partial [Mrakia frigida]|uniref:glycosyltransferase family 15 protein n=1 Tax=Mrakia frigida TaxID=29902 RepID=UPI003FCC2480
YPYVFLNDEPFTDEFKRHTRAVASTECHYGLIEKEVWNQPSWIDEAKATESRKKMSDQCVVRPIRSCLALSHSDADLSTRSRSGFNSGHFFRHPLLQQFKFYWRLEPDVQFFCDIHTDPFLEMQDEEKVYGFVMAMYEFRETIETLWESTREFMSLYPQHIAKGNSMGAISDDGGKEYNNCHFWSNFEIADMDFWRSDAYLDYFNFLDQKGGFYYERWGDAPVHSIAAALFLPKDKIKFFDNHGYRHSAYQRCPVDKAHDVGRCTCRESDTFDNDSWVQCLSSPSASLRRSTDPLLYLRSLVTQMELSSQVEGDSSWN